MSERKAPSCIHVNDAGTIDRSDLDATRAAILNPCPSTPLHALHTGKANGQDGGQVVGYRLEPISESSDGQGEATAEPRARDDPAARQEPRPPPPNPRLPSARARSSGCLVRGARVEHDHAAAARPLHHGREGCIIGSARRPAWAARRRSQPATQGGEHGARDRLLGSLPPPQDPPPAEALLVAEASWST